jgi:hypothetical protein
MPFQSETKRLIAKDTARPKSSFSLTQDGQFVCRHLGPWYEPRQQGTRTLRENL